MTARKHTQHLVSDQQHFPGVKKIMLIIPFFFLMACVQSQTNSLQGWHLKDQKASGYFGISLNQAYDFLATKKIKSNPVIVAILDDGIDTTHEDLKPVLWVNKKEIPGNGIDDDHNGYADDVHGWNFLGNPDGRIVTANSSEWIRVYWRYKTQYEGVSVDTAKLGREHKYEYALWQKARSGVVGKGMKEEELKKIRNFLNNMVFADSIIKPRFTGNEYTQKSLATYEPANELETAVKDFLLKVFKQEDDPEIKNSFLLEEIEKYVVSEERRAAGDKVPPENVRGDITGDDDKTMVNRLYGNKDIQGGGLMHGTHLAGIVAAMRNNGIGMDGVADNVQLMMVRVNADGDEYDKDIAMGIIYAVNNGAKVINMSFGKSLSPDKKFIDDAVKYAASKDVLLVQAAGNSKRDINGFDNFPNPKFLFSDSLAANWITVGASDTLGRAAAFSNYGNKVVNVFSPGVAIFSTIPLGNKYMSWEGTSMASPVVSGVAALLRSYFPKLAAIQVKRLIEENVSKPSTESIQPGTSGKVMMDKLCTSGGVVNAFKAVKAAFLLQ